MGVTKKNMGRYIVNQNKYLTPYKMSTPVPKSSIKKTPTSLKDSAYLLALIENRAREVGIACINLKSYEITLTQFVDNCNYFHTLSILYSWDPIEIILSKTLENTPIHHQLNSHLQNFPLTFISRKFFDEVKGEELFISSLQKVYEQDVEKKYVGMAALSGLIFYIESTQNILIYRGRLKITLIHLKDFLVLDFYSIKTLEIVLSLENSRKESLAGLFDCKTQAGARMLRASLLQPVRDKQKILIRQESVQELMSNNIGKVELKTCLLSFSNTELVTSRLLQKPKTSNDRFMKTQIVNVLNVFNNLRSAKELLNILVKREFVSEGIKILKDLLDDRRVDSLYEEIENLLSSEILAVRTKNITVSHCISCIKEGVNTLLDVSRQVLSNYLEDLHKLESQYRYKLSEPSLSVIYTTVRGYHLQLDSNVIKKNYQSTLGEYLLQITHKGKKCQATTASLMSLNEKIKNSQSNIISLTYSLIEDLSSKVREKILVLYNISHIVASLDILIAYSSFSTTFECVKPEITQNSIKLKDAKNPLLLTTGNPIGICVSFSYYKRLFVLTGMNSSGKTTFLKTVALVCLLAHTGCFVPASAAKVCSLEYILTRLGEKESIEQKSSSFMAEMKDSSYILNTVCKRSLVLMDELGSGTNKSEGVAVAWSICEKLYDFQCFCIFSTHFREITQVDKVFLGVRNLFMKDFKVNKGKMNEVIGYGIDLALKSSLPQSLTLNAKKLLSRFGECNEEERDEKFYYKKKAICVLGFLVNSADPEMLRNKILSLIEK